MACTLDIPRYFDKGILVIELCSPKSDDGQDALKAVIKEDLQAQTHKKIINVECPDSATRSRLEKEGLEGVALTEISSALSILTYA